MGYYGTLRGGMVWLVGFGGMVYWYDDWLVYWYGGGVLWLVGCFWFFGLVWCWLVSGVGWLVDGCWLLSMFPGFSGVV